jgi:hypothetical protein
MDDQTQKTPIDEVPVGTTSSSVEPQPASNLLVSSQPAPFKRSQKMPIIVGLLLLILIAAGLYMLLKPKKTTPASIVKPSIKSTTTTNTVNSQLCFVRLGYLNCVDSSGQNRVRYDLPVLLGNQTIDTISASANNSDYVAQTNNSTPQVAILNAKLAVTKQLTVPTGMTPNSPSLSQDGKSVLLELSDQGNNRQVYRYTIATDKYSKLTSIGLNSKPFETKDGHIVYSHFTGSSWLAYIMNNDGTNPHALPPNTSVSSPLDFSYDQYTDTIYVYGINEKGTALTSYATVADYLSNKVTVVSIASLTSSNQQIIHLSRGKLIVASSIEGNIINIADGKIETKLKQFGPIVGFLDTAQFQKSKQQVEQPHDRIINLASAPADFQTYIEQQFDVADPTCTADGVEYRIDITKVVNDSFATAEVSCDSGYVQFYAKVNSTWQKAFAGQMESSCTDVNTYKFTKQIIPECTPDNSSISIPNKNP